MSKLTALLGLIRAVIDDFEFPDNIREDKAEILVKAESSDQPVVIDGNSIVVYAGTKEGAQIEQSVFENAESLMNKGERIIETGFAKLINEAEPYSEMLEKDVRLLEQLKNIVPKSDIQIISAGLFIRRLYKNKQNVTRYKKMVGIQFGQRGTNISNLISADYYEDYVIPTYQQLLEEEGIYAKDIFNEMYEEAVTQYPFAVFVSVSKNYSDIKEEVLNKIQLNILNDQHILNINGIGSQNKKTITKILGDPDVTKFYSSDPDIVNLKKTVYARLYF